ncbi:RhuM family protein [Psychrosphaera haliotis]
MRKFRTVALEDSREVERLLDHYNLEAVLSVGYRVRHYQNIE